MAELLDEAVNAHAIVYDQGLGEWETMARAWRVAQDAATKGHMTHALVLQDDAIPVEGFTRTVLAAIDQHPEKPLSLYLGRKKPARWETNVAFAVNVAEREGFSWLQSSHLLHGVALVMPAPWIAPMLAWCRKSNAPYDERIGFWIRNVLRVPVLYPQPSLVDHNDDTPSLVRHADDSLRGTTGRVAYRFGRPTWESPDVLDIMTPIGAPA